jgi:hypothetical protein
MPSERRKNWSRELASSNRLQPQLVGWRLVAYKASVEAEGEWAQSAQNAYDDVIQANGDVVLVISNFRRWLGENAMMAYIVMMAARLLELRRVLKTNGSLYLHCDPTASAVHQYRIMKSRPVALSPPRISSLPNNFAA